VVDRRLIGDASTEAGIQTGIPARFYEKDFYITAVLRALSEQIPSQFIFKGGTSLSKVQGRYQPVEGVLPHRPVL